MRNQDRQDGLQKAEDREPLPGAVKKRGDATEAGGGNLHRGRGATAWGREDKRRRDRGRRGQPGGDIKEISLGGK